MLSSCFTADRLTESRNKSFSNGLGNSTVFQRALCGVENQSHSEPVSTVRSGSGVVQNAVDEMAALAFQRFAHLDRRYGNVAVSQRQKLTVRQIIVGHVHTLVIDLDLLRGSMSSNTTIFFEPTTVVRRILCGSSQLTWTFAIFPPGYARLRNTTSSTPFWR